VTIVGGNVSGYFLSMNATKMIQLDWSATAPNTGSLGFIDLDISTEPGQTFQVGVNGEADVGAIAANPSPQLVLGPLCAGSSASQDVMVYATDTGNVQLVSATASPSPFSASVTPGTLMHMHNNEIAVHATVTPTAPGDPTGTLTIGHDIPNTQPLTIALSAHVLQSGITPTPDPPIHFGTVTTGLFSSEQEVDVTNCSGAALDIRSWHVEGGSPTEFVLSSSQPSIPGMLPSTQTIKLHLVMAPTSNGPKTGMFMLDYADGTHTSILVDGTGMGSDTGGSGSERETYYACSTGRPGAAWPIGLVLLALRRRRR
jgi:MYXO-CTERM domain-containing protein